MTKKRSKKEPSTNGDNGRNPSGQFARGNPGGPGNPFARRVAAFRKSLLETVTEDDIRAIATRLVQQAKEGDLAATKLLLAYVVGRPPDAIDPDRLDAEEWRLKRELPALVERLIYQHQNAPLDAGDYL